MISRYSIRGVARVLHRKLVFRRAMKRFLRRPEACTAPDDPVVLDLIYGWGNKGWSAWGEYLTACIDHALRTPGPILECGSGLPTIVVGAVAKKRGQRHWALEHSSEWAEKVDRYLRRYDIDSVVLSVSDLRDHGDYLWYEPPLRSMPDSFPLVICDGPPGGVKGGRYGLVPVMRDRLKPGCVILLDDAGREQEAAIARRWETELGATSKVMGSAKPYIEMTVTG